MVFSVIGDPAPAEPLHRVRQVSPVGGRRSSPVRSTLRAQRQPEALGQHPGQPSRVRRPLASTGLQDDGHPPRGRRGPLLHSSCPDHLDRDQVAALAVGRDLLSIADLLVTDGAIDHLGVTGSFLIGCPHEASDIDLACYWLAGVDMAQRLFADRRVIRPYVGADFAKLCRNAAWICRATWDTLTRRERRPSRAAPRLPAPTSTASRSRPTTILVPPRPWPRRWVTSPSSRYLLTTNRPWRLGVVSGRGRACRLVERRPRPGVHPSDPLPALVRRRVSRRLPRRRAHLAFRSAVGPAARRRSRGRADRLDRGRPTRPFDRVTGAPGPERAAEV